MIGLHARRDDDGRGAGRLEFLEVFHVAEEAELPGTGLFKGGNGVDLHRRVPDQLGVELCCDVTQLHRTPYDRMRNAPQGSHFRMKCDVTCTPAKTPPNPTFPVAKAAGPVPRA